MFVGRAVHRGQSDLHVKHDLIISIHQRERVVSSCLVVAHLKINNFLRVSDKELCHSYDLLLCNPGVFRQYEVIAPQNII